MPANRRGPYRQGTGRPRLPWRTSGNSPNTVPSIPPSNVSKQKTPTDNNTALLPVCHPAIPDLRCLSNMLFETVFLLYLHIALFCQYIYLYKTVWWYPISLPPSTTSLNFHLIDGNLTLFLTAFLSRRLIWSVLWDFLRPHSDNSPALFAWILLCLFTVVVWVSLLITPLIYLYYSTTLVNMLVIYYPVIVWMPLTGISDSCLNQVVSWASLTDGHKSNCINEANSDSESDCHKLPPVNRLLDNPETTGDSKTSYANLGNALDAPQVREEVQLLCRDFNSRISEILFCSMVCAYYVGLVPMFFIQSHQYYDIVWCLQHTVLVLFNSFTLLSSHLLHPRYVHVLHKCASLLGGYKLESSASGSGNGGTRTSNDVSQIERTLHADEDTPVWSSYNVYPPGSRVQYKDKTYITIGKHNTAQPDNVTHSRFFFMFNNPLKLINILLFVHLLIVLFQIGLLVFSWKWDHLISVAMMQFFSYYILFRILRDRIVLGKAYTLHENIYQNSQL